MPRWFGMAPPILLFFVLLLAGCSRTVPCTDSSQSANTATAKPPPSNPVEATQQAASPPALASAQPRPGSKRVQQKPQVSHVEREPVVVSGTQPPSVGEADRMAPPARLNVEIPAGTDLEVRLNQSLDTRTT